MRNLLFEKNKKILRREYLFRLATVVLIFLFFSIISGFIFLTPSYFISQEKETGIKNQAEISRASIASREQEASSLILVEARQKIDLLSGYEEQTRISNIFKIIVEDKPAGLQIIRLSYQETSVENEVVVGGVSSRRETLLSFKQKLEEEELFTEVNLPISNLASDADIKFSIRIHGAF